MARGVNKVILVGNCGQDPETKYTASGAAVTNISIATSDSWKDKQTGQMQERTEWHRVVLFNRLAEIAGEYLRKGSKVYLEGRLQTRSWKDQNGQDRYTTEIVASEMQMLDSRGDNSNQYGGGQQANSGFGQQQASNGGYQQNQQQGGFGSGQQQQQSHQGGNYNQGGYQQQNYGGGSSSSQNQPPAPPMDMDSFDDDIPF